MQIKNLKILGGIVLAWVLILTSIAVRIFHLPNLLIVEVVALLIAIVYVHWTKIHPSIKAKEGDEVKLKYDDLSLYISLIFVTLWLTCSELFYCILDLGVYR